MNKHAWASKNTREYYDKETQIVKLGGKYTTMNKYEILRQKIQQYAASLAVQAPEDRKWAMREREKGFFIEGDKLDAGAKVKKTICDDLLDILQTIY